MPVQIEALPAFSQVSLLHNTRQPKYCSCESSLSPSYRVRELPSGPQVETVAFGSAVIAVLNPGVLTASR